MEQEPTARPEMREIATIGDGRDITRGLLGTDYLLPQDEILQAKGGNYRIYEWVRSDDQVMSTFQQRRLAVVSREWEVEPGGKTKLDRKAADSLKTQLEHVGWDRVSDMMLWGVYYGYAVAECLYARDGREVVLDAIKVRRQRRFVFGLDQRPRLLTLHNPRGEELPPRKFWHFNTGADNDDEPYGLGLAHWLYWPVWFKRNDIKFWLIFLEKFGMPTAIGEYDKSASPAEIKKLLQAAGAIQSEAAIVIPQGMALRLLEAARSGAADHAGLHQAMNEAIAKIVLSQTMTTENGSSRAQGEVHERVGDKVSKADADLKCGSFNRGPATWLTEWNYPGAKPPRVWRRIEDDPDLKPQADRDKVIYDMGFKPTLDYITSTYGDGFEPRSDMGRPPPGAPGAAPASGEEPGAGDGAEFAAGDTDSVDDAVRQALADDGWEPLMEPVVQPVRRLFETARSFDEIREGLAAAFAEMDDAALAELLARFRFAARLAGTAGDPIADIEGGQ